MTFDKYQELAMRTVAPDSDLTTAALGLTGESAELFRACIGLTIFAGNFADITKKYMHHGHSLEYDKSVEELGDVLWYLALAAHCMGSSLNSIAYMNIEKLEARYPSGFDSERSKGDKP